MTTFLLEALFVAGGAFALASVIRTAHNHAPAIARLRQEFNAAIETRELVIEVTEVSVKWQAPVLRPDFTRRAAAPAAGRGLRAAA